MGKQTTHPTLLQVYQNICEADEPASEVWEKSSPPHKKQNLGEKVIGWQIGQPEPTLNKSKVAVRELVTTTRK